MMRSTFIASTLIGAAFGNPHLPGLTWLQANQDVDSWLSAEPPTVPLEGRLTQKMCTDRVLPESFIYDHIDWFTFGEEKGHWLERYAAQNDRGICWGAGKQADKWFKDTMAGKNCGRPWMVLEEQDVPVSRWQQYTDEAPAVLGLDPTIIKFCRDLEGDSRVVPDLNDPFWFTWESAGMPKPAHTFGPMNIIESNLLQACSAANRNILRVSAMAQRKTAWDMCSNVEWVVCAAKGMLPNQGNKIEFATPPGLMDGSAIGSYREYRSKIMRESANYEVDMLALTYYMNEICWLSTLCDNADELWSVTRSDQWTCEHSEEGEARLKNLLLQSYKKGRPVVEDYRKNVKEHRFAKSGHVSQGGHVGGHMSGGHGGHVGGHMSGGHVGGHMSGGHVGGGHSTGSSGEETSSGSVTLDEVQQTMTTTVTVTGKSPTKAQLQTAMLASLPTGSSVTVALQQTCTVGFDDPNDFFCGSGAAANILANSEKGMGKTMNIYDTTTSNAWNTGCSMTGSCAAVSSGRRQLSSHSNTVNFATTSTTDVSQYVGHDSTTASTFATNLVTNIGTYATGVTVPAVVVDQSSIEYVNVVTYVIVSSSTIADSTLQSSATSALTAALTNVGFSATDAANLAAAAQTTVVSGGSTTADSSTAGATTAATSAGLVVMMASMLALFM